MKLKGDISLAQIQKFRGVIDFYYWKGIPCARSWPNKPKHPRTPAQVATWSAFADMMTWKKTLTTAHILQWRSMNLPIGRSAEDQIRKFGLRMAYAHQLVEPPRIQNIVATHLTVQNKTRIKVSLIPFFGWDPAKVYWQVKGYVGGPDGLQWYVRTHDVTRQASIKQVYEPAFNGFTPIARDVRDIVDNVWTLVIDGLWDSIELIPKADYPEQDPNMLGPLYSVTT